MGRFATESGAEKPESSGSSDTGTTESSQLRDLERVWNPQLGIYQLQVKDIDQSAGAAAANRLEEPAERGDPMAQLGRWSPAERKASQDLLQRAGYLPGNYVPSGSLDQKFVNAWNSYMNDRDSGLGIALTPETVSQFEAARPAARAARGRAAPAPSFGVGDLKSRSQDELSDKVAKLYEQWTGGRPDAPTLEWVTNHALGGKTAFETEQAVRNTPEFRTRYRGMPAGMEIGEYDGAVSAGNAEALQVAGRPMNDQERGLMFAGKGEDLYHSFKGDLNAN